MTGAGNRRDALRLVAAAATLPLGTAFWAPASLASDLTIALPVPDGAMELQRTVVREMANGAELRVTRRWRIRFVARAAGMAVLGEQLGAEVDAPAGLEAIAKMEEQRVETNLFPLDLDGAGLIVGAPEPRLAGELDAAIGRTQAMIAQLGLARQEELTIRQQLALFQQSAASLMSRVPPDLLYPQALAWHEERARPVMPGVQGTVSVRFTAETQDCCALLKQSSRVVETRIAGTARRAIEQWTLLK